MEMCKTLLGFAHFHRHRRHEPKQQNRTLHLLQKPDIFICYRHKFRFPNSALRLLNGIGEFY